MDRHRKLNHAATRAVPLGGGGGGARVVVAVVGQHDGGRAESGAVQRLESREWREWGGSVGTASARQFPAALSPTHSPRQARRASRRRRARGAAWRGARVFFCFSFFMFAARKRKATKSIPLFFLFLHVPHHLPSPDAAATTPAQRTPPPFDPSNNDQHAHRHPRRRRRDAGRQRAPAARAQPAPKVGPRRTRFTARQARREKKTSGW